MPNQHRDPRLDTDPFAQADLDQPLNRINASDPFISEDSFRLDPVGIDASEIQEAEELQEPLRSLMREHGLVAVLEALRSLIAAQADRLKHPLDPEHVEPVQAFEQATAALTALIQTIPAELDMELALAQITHTAPTLEPASIKLGAE